VSEVWAAWASAGATFLAVVVALFGPAWDRRRRSPRLRLTAEAPERLGPNSTVVFVPAPAGDGRIWLRLMVSNEGMSTAEAVRVLLLSVRTPAPLEHQPPLRELKWGDIPSETMTLAPGEIRPVDLIRLETTSPGMVAGFMCHSPSDEAHPGHRLWWPLLSGGYQFELSVSAKDVPARRYVATCDLHVEGSTAQQLASQLRKASLSSS